MLRQDGRTFAAARYVVYAVYIWMKYQYIYLNEISI